EQDRMKMIREALRVLRPEGHLIVVEYSRPRRSYIHIPWLIITLIEHLAGGEHRAGFRQFMATGGLRGLLQRHNLEATEMTYSHFHSLAVASIPIRRCP
ncbi:hypothetical protein KKG90_07080, partial [Candidatus Bipolaricaulota bacterium]|nr:hypothetical protein [Candidatus Bipolaricaulota bacterium]